jgi:hypothetical protein
MEMTCALQVGNTHLKRGSFMHRALHRTARNVSPPCGRHALEAQGSFLVRDAPEAVVTVPVAARLRHEGDFGRVAARRTQVRRHGGFGASLRLRKQQAAHPSGPVAAPPHPTHTRRG